MIEAERKKHLPGKAKEPLQNYDLTYFFVFMFIFHICIIASLPGPVPTHDTGIPTFFSM
jgi:hypothetical protein